MDRNPSTGPTRRRVLGALAAAGLGSVAGCNASSETTDSPGAGTSYATDLVACSVAGGEKTVAITVTAIGADTPRTERTLKLSPGDVVDPVNDGKIPGNGDGYTVEVDIDGGASETFEWTDIGPERAPLWVLIPDGGNIRFLLDAQ